MTARSVSLLMLFVVGLGASAVLLAALQPLALRLGLSTPWLVPVAGVLCFSATLFAGRRYILPGALASTRAQALVALITVTTASMAVVYGLVWLVQTFIVLIPGALTLVLWFAALWFAIGTLHRAGRQQRLPLS